MEPASGTALRVGRYGIFGEIASGGIATVHFGRLLGSAGFSRTVAVKRLHPQYAKDPDFAAMFVDEARLAARVRHPNVVPMLDVVSEANELFLVMEYVAGESVARLLREASVEDASVPLPIVRAIMRDMLYGLHAAHEAKNESDELLEIVHRDVSPQNVIVGVDGVSRVVDFGVAKAIGRSRTTRDGTIKGKLGYMSPEQLRGERVDRRTDIYAAGVVLWELLTGRRLHDGENEGAIVTSILEGAIDPPSKIAGDRVKALDPIAMRALSRRPQDRYGTALLMAAAIEEAGGEVAGPVDVGRWVTSLAGDALEARENAVREIERDDASGLERVARGELATAADPNASRAHTRSVTSTATRTRRARWGALTAFFAGISVTAAVFIGLAKAREPTPAPTIVTPSASAAMLTTPTGETAPIDPSTATPSASIATWQDLPPSDPPRTAPPSRVGARPNGAKRPAASASAGCPVKSYVDDGGVKHFFKECK